MVKTFSFTSGLVAAALVAASSAESANLRGGRSLQYDNIPNAIITFSNNPGGAQQGIADQAQSNQDSLNTALQNLGTAIASGGAFGTSPAP